MEREISGTAPSHVLLIRNLDPLTTDEDLAAVLLTLPAAEDNAPAPGLGLKQVLLVKDRKTTGSWCFAFAVFADVAVSSCLRVRDDDVTGRSDRRQGHDGRSEPDSIPSRLSSAQSTPGRHLCPR